MFKLKLIINFLIMQLSFKNDPNKIEILNKTKKIFLDVCNNTVQDTDLNYKDHVGGTPLAWACILGNYELVDQLIKRGSNPDVKVFPFLYQVIKIDWILDPALSIITALLPSQLKIYLKKANILRIFKTLKEFNYINDDGIYLKYIINILVETTNYNCFNNSMLERWKTQEDFNRKMKLSFWLYPKIVDCNNYFIHKFYKDPVISEKLRSYLLFTFRNNPNISYKKIEELIPINKLKIDPFLNNAWVNIIIPEMVKGMMVRVVCDDKL